MCERTYVCTYVDMGVTFARTHPWKIHCTLHCQCGLGVSCGQPGAGNKTAMVLSCVGTLGSPWRARGEGCLCCATYVAAFAQAFPEQRDSCVAFSQVTSSVDLSKWTRVWPSAKSLVCTAAPAYLTRSLLLLGVHLPRKEQVRAFHHDLLLTFHQFLTGKIILHTQEILFHKFLKRACLRHHHLLTSTNGLGRNPIGYLGSNLLPYLGMNHQSDFGTRLQRLH